MAGVTATPGTDCPGFPEALVGPNVKLAGGLGPAIVAAAVFVYAPVT